MDKNVKERLFQEYEFYNNQPLKEQHEDPIMVAKIYKDPIFSLMIALFSYGSAKQIVKFVSRIDYKSMLLLGVKKYRFQTESDVEEILRIFKKMREDCVNLEVEVLKNNAEQNQIKSIKNLQDVLYKYAEKDSEGLVFYFGKKMVSLESSKNGALKRYNMFLRWMVRHDNVDMGIFKKYSTKNLVIPVDVHVGRVAIELGLTKRLTNDFKRAQEITDALKELDKNDPVKFDFAIYRIGQRGVF